MAKQIQNKAKMGFNEPPFRAKYGNVPVDAMVNGQHICFRSKLEYRWAQYLDFLKSLGEIKDFFYEFHTFRGFPENQPVKEYTPDFLVRTNDNEFEYHETKGMLSAYDLKKFKLLFDERPCVKLIVVFWGKPKISVNKRAKLERWTHRVIYEARKILKNVSIDLA